MRLWLHTHERALLLTWSGLLTAPLALQQLGAMALQPSPFPEQLVRAPYEPLLFGGAKKQVRVLLVQNYPNMHKRIALVVLQLPKVE
jgi:hypothetical protein